ncbi:hypothetical protein [Flavobacterium chilense]|uniref:Uncharacterized protein n=1 Tax=Flavobacterium chilense TaxID=946677 RepID=A0A1M7N1H2_9FLAO|nr:hypothetical protein [Flavobacterium chilense]SHM97189.1 hypothetical protein SAMN05444484_11723 [Flavobacterium chilense]
MDWNYIKDKILVFGKDDYIFADMMISILDEFDSVVNKESKRIFTLKMLHELMQEKLIDVFYVTETEFKSYNYDSEDDILKFIGEIDLRWSKLNYELPLPNELFWATTTKQGKKLTQNNNYNW